MSERLECVHVRSTTTAATFSTTLPRHVLGLQLYFPDRTMCSEMHKAFGGVTSTVNILSVLQAQVSPRPQEAKNA